MPSGGFSEPLVTLPAERHGNLLLLEVKWDRSGPYRFLIDTGSSATLVSPDFARRYGQDSNQPPATPGEIPRTVSCLPSMTTMRPLS